MTRKTKNPAIELIAGFPYHDWCRRDESNTRPSHYETVLTAKRCRLRVNRSFNSCPLTTLELRMNLTSEQVLAAMPGWWAPLGRKAVAWVLQGPSWVPFIVRRVPLRFCVLVARVAVYRLSWRLK